MAVTDNILKQVITYNDSALAYLLNSFAFISTANKKFQRFNDDVPKNLGDTVSFDLPPRFTTTNSLAILADFQPAVQRFLNLTVDKQAATAYEFNAQQFIFNARDYMDKFGKSAIAEIGSKVESDVSSLAETHTNRFYNFPVTELTYGELGKSLANFRAFGAAKDKTKGYLSLQSIPNIVDKGLSQFVIKKNEREMMSWELGSFSNCDWYQSNLLKFHSSGTVGKAGTTLTVVSVVVNAANGVTSITFSGAGVSDANAVKAYDKFQFQDGVTGQPNLRFRTFIGHEVTGLPLQFAAIADAASNGAGQVTVTLAGGPGDFPALQATSTALTGATQNINVPIVAGMQVKALPDHRCGLITSGDPLFLGMPKLPDEVPFPTSAAMDSDSGCSMRMYYGSLFGQNRRGMVHDVIWGRTLVPEYSQMIALPV